MQPVAGSADPAHIAQIAAAADVTMERSEWYDVYRAAGNGIP